MRYRLMATYQGVPYEAGVGPASGDVVLFAACPPPEELGFEPATGHWRKQLPIGELQALWESRPTGSYRGERCMILDDLGDRLHIAYLGHDAYQAERLGYWQVDRGVFELVTPRDDVTAITEERSDYPGEAGPPGQPAAEPDYRPPVAGPYPPQPPGYLADQPPASRAAGHPAGMTADPSAGYGQSAAGPGWNGHGSHDGYGADHPAGYQQPGYPVPAGYGQAAPAPGIAYPAPQPGGQDPGYPVPPDILGHERPVPPAMPDTPGGVAVPSADEPPLPLEAAAMRASASRQAPADQQQPAAAAPPPPAAQQQAPAAPLRAPARPAVPLPGPGEGGPPGLAGPAAETPWPAPRRRRAAAARQATQRIFSELASQAAIPPGAYSVGAAVDGAMCLLPTERGFEVFTAAGGGKHEVRLFADEESAYFYLFGVLAAEAIRSGALAPRG
jgi:hypothetical protein